MQDSFSKFVSYNHPKYCSCSIIIAFKDFSISIKFTLVHQGKCSINRRCHDKVWKFFKSASVRIVISWSRFKDQTLIKAFTTEFCFLLLADPCQVIIYMVVSKHPLASLPPFLPITPSYCCLPGTLIITLKWVLKVIHICYGCNATISRSWLYIPAPLIHPIRRRTKTKLDWLTNFIPGFLPARCIWFEF